jgi:hypothetical protein
MKPCMGGWCLKRDQCPHHEPTGQAPAERLCLPGQDGVRLIEVTPFRTLTIDVFNGRETRADERHQA